MVDHLGKLMFGRPLRLRLLLWVAARGDTVFFQSEAASEVGYSSANAVAAELARMETLGMVRKFGRPVGNERQNYARADSDYWAIVAAAQSCLEARRGEITEAG